MASNLPLTIFPSSSSIPDQPPQAPIPPDPLHHCLHEVSRGRSPGKPAFISAMKTCASIPDIPSGRTIHAHVVKSGLSADRFVATSIITFYSTCGLLRSALQLFDRIPYKDAVLRTAMLVGCSENGDSAGARKLFDEFPVRDLVSWNAMVSCYLRCGFPEETLNLFRELQTSNLRPNEVTLILALSACSRIGSLAFGERIHAYIIKLFGCRRSTTLSNSLMHMYAKCGKLDVALTIFVEQESKNLESWNAVLTGCGVFGFAKTAFSLFSQIVKNGVRPDRITLLALLTACGHAGVIADAFRYFAGFAELYGVEPGSEHYGCLVDVLARRGHLEEARMLIEGMGMEPNAPFWGALLRGCFTYRNNELGFEAAEQLLELEPRDDGRYVALSNLVAMTGEVKGAVKVRKKMVDLGIKRSSGVSWIEIGGEVLKFLSGDRSCIQSMHIYATVENLHSNMRLPTYKLASEF